LPKRRPIRRILPWERLPQHHAEVVGGDQEVAVLETQGGDFKIQTKEHEYELDPEPEINIDAENVFIIKKGVEISYIDLGVDGALEVKRLALALEDGTIVGDSWLATFLRGDVLRRGPLGLNDLMRRYNNGYFGAALVKARVYVPDEGDVPEGSVAQHGKRGGIYYETRPKLKMGDVVSIRGRTHENIGIVAEKQYHRPDEGIVDVEIQSPYGNYNLPFKAENLQIVKHNKPRAGQKERREKRQGRVLGQVITQFANDVRSAKARRVGGWKDTYYIGEHGFHRYDTDDGIAIYVPLDARGGDDPAALSLKRLMNYIAKMPPAAVQDLRKHVKKIVLSPVIHPTDPTVWGTMAKAGSELTIYPDVKREGANEEFGRGTFHGPNPPLPDVAVARVLTHEVGHAVYNYVTDELANLYNDKAKEFWDAYEQAGGFMPASTPRMNAVMAANGIPRDPTYGWRLAYLDAAEIERARYNATEPKIRSYDIPAELRSEMPPAHPAGYGEDKPVGTETFTWEELPPKVKAAFIEKTHVARPITGYAAKNEHEWYAEAYEYYRWGRLPSDHVLYPHFQSIPKTEAWVRQKGPIKIKSVSHRHEPAGWNRDEGLYHMHAPAPKGHKHEGA